MRPAATEPAAPRSVSLLLEHDRTRAGLEQWLASTDRYSPADGPFDTADVVIADGPSFARARDEITHARRSIAPVFLPVVLVTPHQDASLLTDGLWREVDEVLTTPLRPEELLVRLERLVYVRDLSRQGAERARELSRSNSDLERYAFVAAHELRSPLTVVSGVLATLNGRYRHMVGEEAHALLDVGWAASIRMGALVDDILAFSRMEGPRVRMPVALGPLVAEVVDGLEGDPRIAVGELPTVSADPDQLAIVFRNLLGNALKFERPGIPIAVSVDAERRDDAWEIRVADNGVGIPETELQSVFELFQRGSTGAEYHGSGIGLAICRRILELHVAEIHAERNEAGGTTFCFLLPG